jgi:uncharacterized protein YdeI (YjbR/CyaY-like superfamily)
MPKKPTLDELERLYFPTRQAWREWLMANHDTSPGIWLILHKKNSSQPSVPYVDAVEEALCFGWIDSKAKSLDDERFIQVFTPRKPKGVWSKVNKARIAALIANGSMALPGLEKIDAAKRDGSWTSLDAIEELVIPPDLAEALAENQTAQRNFEAFAPSIKKQILYWVASAKLPETRTKRIEQVVTQAIEKKNPVAYVPKKK